MSTTPKPRNDSESKPGRMGRARLAMCVFFVLAVVVATIWGTLTLLTSRTRSERQISAIRQLVVDSAAWVPYDTSALDVHIYNPSPTAVSSNVVYHVRVHDPVLNTDFDRRYSQRLTIERQHVSVERVPLGLSFGPQLAPVVVIEPAESDKDVPDTAKKRDTEEMRLSHASPKPDIKVAANTEATGPPPDTYVALPNGNYVKVPANATTEQLHALGERLRVQYGSSRKVYEIDYGGRTYEITYGGPIEDAVKHLPDLLAKLGFVGQKRSTADAGLNPDEAEHIIAYVRKRYPSVAKLSDAAIARRIYSAYPNDFPELNGHGEMHK